MPFVHIVTLKDAAALEARATLRYGGLPELLDYLTEYDDVDDSEVSDESIAGSFDTVYVKDEYRIVLHEDRTVSLERKL
jgi:hypothetical protein